MNEPERHQTNSYITFLGLVYRVDIFQPTEGQPKIQNKSSYNSTLGCLWFGAVSLLLVVFMQKLKIG